MGCAVSAPPLALADMAAAAAVVLLVAAGGVGTWVAERRLRRTGQVSRRGIGCCQAAVAVEAAVLAVDVATRNWGQAAVAAVTLACVSGVLALNLAGLRRRTAAAATAVRPRAGLVYRAAGYVEEARFVPSADPRVFLAVTVDGERIRLRYGDGLGIDQLGPGQTVRADADPPPGWPR